MRILLVEDDKVLADALSRALVQSAHADDAVIHNTAISINARSQRQATPRCAHARRPDDAPASVHAPMTSPVGPVVRALFVIQVGMARCPGWRKHGPQQSAAWRIHVGCIAAPLAGDPFVFLLARRRCCPCASQARGSARLSARKHRVCLWMQGRRGRPLPRVTGGILAWGCGTAQRVRMQAGCEWCVRLSGLSCRLARGLRGAWRNTATSSTPPSISRPQGGWESQG